MSLKGDWLDSPLLHHSTSHWDNDLHCNMNHKGPISRVHVERQPSAYMNRDV